MKINNFDIDDSNNTFIIAELSANHKQDFEIAKKTIIAAKEAGADAIKLQTYTPDTLTIDCDNEYFQIKSDTIWDGVTLYELYKQAYTPWEWHPELKKIAEDVGLIFFSTPFDKSAVDFLESLNLPAYKIASFEIVDLPLIEYVARKNKPIIISTGIATEEDISEAIMTCHNAGNNHIALLKCTSEYPAPIEEANLLTIPYLKEKFKTVVGLSDHTLGTIVPSAAVALGAKIIEKHFILDRNLGGADSSFSLEPTEFKKMVEEIRNVEKSLGKIDLALNDKKQKSRMFARSIFVVKDIKAGELFTEENVRSIRPSNGLHPKNLKNIIGKSASRDLKKGTPLSKDLIAD